MKRKKLKIKNSWENNKKKVKSVLYKLVYIFGVILVIYNVLYIVNNTLSGKKYINIFGKIYITTEKEDSMKKGGREVNSEKSGIQYVKKNDLVFVIKTSEKNINIQDIIGYDINDEITLHRVVNIENKNNTIYYETKADNYINNDIERKTINQINGKIFIKIPLIGIIFRVIENKAATIIIVILLFLKFSLNKYKYERYGKIKRKNKKHVIQNS